MSCRCGKKIEYNEGVPDRQAIESSKRVVPGGPLPQISFEYFGFTGMTVVGPITGRVYRFDRAGAVVAVDTRDAPSFVAVPNLRRL